MNCCEQEVQSTEKPSLFGDVLAQSKRLERQMAVVRILCLRVFRKCVSREGITLAAIVFFCFGTIVLWGSRLSSQPGSDSTPACRNTQISLHSCLVSGCCGSADLVRGEIDWSTGVREKREQRTVRDDISFGSCDSAITIVYAPCGAHNIRSAINSMKSLLMSISCPIQAIFFTEQETRSHLTKLLSETFPAFMFPHSVITSQVLELRYPAALNVTGWSDLSGRCGFYRAFLPSSLHDTDAVIYADADTIFLKPIEQLWAYFGKMSQVQVASLSPDYEDPDISWYNKQESFPYVEPLGVSATVMLLNLTRMRTIGWERELLSLLQNYGEEMNKLKVGDEVLINAFFHDRPDALMLLPCHWNFRHHHCHLNYCNCRSAKSKGIALLHGSLDTSQEDQLIRSPYFGLFYEAFNKYDIRRDDVTEDFLEPLGREMIRNGRQPSCSSLYTHTFAQVAQVLRKTQ